MSQYVIEPMNGREPNSLAPTGQQLQLIFKHGIERVYWGRALRTLAISAMTTPLRWQERRQYHKQVEETAITLPPVFILGHWRSGTTHLHSLLAQDPQWGYVTTFQSSSSALFFVGQKTMIEQVRKNAPQDRIVDAMKLNVDGPQEEECAMMCYSPHSYYHAFFTYPKAQDYYWDKYVAFKTITPEEKAAWQHDFMWILKQATLNFKGKRLILKSPPNTGRVRQLLELFPDAKFIHIYRNPYHTFASMVKMYRKTLALGQLQQITLQQIQDFILKVFVDLMTAYDEQKSLIPTGNLIEVRYEDLVDRPLPELRRLYEKFGLGGYDANESQFQSYLRSVTDYPMAQYPPNAATDAVVESQWGKWINGWGYHAPSAEPKRA